MGNIREYCIEYCQSHGTLLWNYIILWCMLVLKEKTYSFKKKIRGDLGNIEIIIYYLKYIFVQCLVFYTRLTFQGYFIHSDHACFLTSDFSPHSLGESLTSFGYCDMVVAIIVLCNQKQSLTPWILVSVNLMSIALHFVHVGHEVVNIVNMQHGLEVPSANFLYLQRWKFAAV